MKQVFQVVSFGSTIEGSYKTEKRAQEKVEKLKSTYNYPQSAIKIVIRKDKMTKQKKTEYVFVVVYCPRGCPSGDTRIEGVFKKESDAMALVDELAEDDDTDFYVTKYEVR